jgi:uncharacterized membrane protein YfcA
MTDDLIVLLITGLAAGLLGGLLGIGGGVVLMPVLRFVVGLSPAEAAGTCVLAVFFTTLGGGIKHYRLGHVPMRGLWPVILAGILSTLVFSTLFFFLARHGRWLDFGIGCVFALIALRMVLDTLSKGTADTEPAPMITGSNTRKTTLGILAGILPGLFGIGTGAVLVPGFSYLLNAPIKIAIGSALVCFCANALISAVMKYAQGYVNLGLALPVCLGCLAGAQLGAAINHRMPSRALKLMFGLVFAWVSFRFIASGLWGAP